MTDVSAARNGQPSIDVPWFIVEIQVLRDVLTALVEAVEEDFAPHQSRGARTVRAIAAAKEALCD